MVCGHDVLRVRSRFEADPVGEALCAHGGPSRLRYGKSERLLAGFGSVGPRCSLTPPLGGEVSRVLVGRSSWRCSAESVAPSAFLNRQSEAGFATSD
jgi:hypothetical protein